MSAKSRSYFGRSRISYVRPVFFCTRTIRTVYILVPVVTLSGGIPSVLGLYDEFWFSTAAVTVTVLWQMAPKGGVRAILCPRVFCLLTPLSIRGR